MLYPADDDVAKAVDSAVALVRLSMTASSTSRRAARTLPYTVDITPESAGWT